MSRNLASYNASETLPCGQRLHLRAIRPNDREALRAGFLKLSKQSVRDRFFSFKLDLTPAELTYYTEVDFDQHLALVAELESGGEWQAVAVGRLVRESRQPEHAEIAITVIDEMQGKGIGKIMLRHLATCARDLGVRQMDASVLAENKRMLGLIRKLDLPFTSRLQDGIRTISVSL